MNNRAQLGLWGAILGVFLLAILGIKSASDWLTQSTPSDPADQSLTITSSNGNRVDRDIEQDGSGLSTSTEDRIVADPNQDRISAQTDQQANQQTVPLTFSPLEEAGTYIQRQKRVERDSFVAATRVEAVPVASSNNTAAASDSRVTQPAPATISDTQPSQTRPATETAAPAVPALW